MVNLLSDKQFKEIMTAIKKKVNIFKNKLQKRKQNKFLRNKVPDNQETGKKNRRYSQENRKAKIRQNKKERKNRKKKELAEIKKSLPNQNAINLTNIEFNQHQQSLLKKGPSFIPIPKDLTWFNLRQYFDKFTNQLRTKFNQAIEKSTEKNTSITTYNSSNSTRDDSNINEQVPKKKYKTNNLYRSRETKNKHLKTFIDTTEKQLFEPKNIKRVRRNLTYEERKALAELKSMENTVVRIQDKGSRFVLLTNEDYENIVEHQIARSSFKELPSDSS